MTSASPSVWRCRHDDPRFARHRTVRTAGQACGRIASVASQSGANVASLLREMPERTSPDDGAAS
jgi:hypothetical protein